jgi:hypothetical protein
MKCGAPCVKHCSTNTLAGARRTWRESRRATFAQTTWPIPDFTWDGYINCREVDGLYRGFKTKGAEITRELEVAFYQMKEFELKACNGHILCFAHDISDEP